jgi:hypothetical protein
VELSTTEGRKRIHTYHKTRAIKTAAIDLYGLDAKEDAGFLDKVAETLAGETLEDALSVIKEYVTYYRLGEQKNAPGQYGPLRGETGVRVTPLRSVQHLVKPDDETAQRIRALSHYLARIATVDKNVLRYRKIHLGGFTKTISEEEAQEWPDHPALRRVCRHLAKHYPWTEEETRYFVLCRAVPQAAKIEGRVQSSFNKPLGVAAHKFNHQTIHLQMPAWMPSELVRKAYVILQRQAYGGREPRRSKERNVALFEFVLERSQVKLVNRNEYLARLIIPDKWAEIMRDWNELHGPGHPWHYTEVSNFRRDFGRGQQAIAGTKYALTGIPGEPRTVAEAQASIGRILEALGRPGARFVEVTAEEIR